MTIRKKVLLLFALATLALSSCKQGDEVRQITELPADSSTQSTTLTQARVGTFALRARVRYQDIEALATQQLPASYPVVDSKRLCKRIIGINACGTAQWRLTIQRPGKLSIRGQDGIVYLQTPIRFEGTVGVDGRVATALRLDALDVAGEAQATIALSVQMRENWCPFIRTDVNYQWHEKPTLVYQNVLDFSLESIVNDALEKQLAGVEKRLNEAIDCGAFKNQLNAYWRSYSFALEIPSAKSDDPIQSMHLNIVPSDFAFSGLRTEKDKLGVSFALGATMVVESQARVVEKLVLPPLRQVSFADSRTEFDLVVRASYTQLEQLLGQQLAGREFTTDSAAGEINVTITSLGLSGNMQDVTVALEFTSTLPGRRKPVNGLIYLRASPVLNPDTEELVLDNIRLSRVIDSTLWSLLSHIFEGQIIESLERNSALDLAPRLRTLENKLTAQLQDPERTGGLNVIATDLTIRVLDIVAESDAIAGRARVSTELDIDVPLAVINKPLR